MIKLTEVQEFRIARAMQEASGVLAEIKIKPLRGPAQEQMRLLEQSVVCLEMFYLAMKVTERGSASRSNVQRPTSNVQRSTRKGGRR